MPRPEYYNLRRTEDRQARIEAIAVRLGLDIEKPATWGAVIDFVLGMGHWLIIEDKIKINGAKQNDP